MAEYDLRLLNSHEFVLHFGGRPNEVDAFTFSNSLISLGEALQEINRQVNPEFSVEVVIEGVGPGSFRAKVGASLVSIGGLFKKRTPDLIVNLLASLIFLKLIQPHVDTPTVPQITIGKDFVVIQSGNDRIVVPLATWKAKEKLSKPKLIDKHISKTFSVLQNDPSVTEFGLAARIDDTAPIGLVPRDLFEVLSESPLDDDPNERLQDHETNLVVVRAIFERSRRLWQFVWNGIKISAPITDPSFFDKLASREYVFGQGDVLLVILRVHQIKDDVANTFLNQSYEVISVRGVQHAAKQQRLPGP